MKFSKAVSVLVILIAVFSFVASAYGIFSTGGPGRFEFEGIRGNSVQIDGTGLYRWDSVSVAAQARAQDVVTLFLGVPLLLGSFFFARKDSLKGRLMLTGTLGYFLYTYASYSFLSMYNSFFLVYVFLFSACLYAFILMMISFDLEKLNSAFDSKMPVKFISGFLFFISLAVGLMWLGRIVPPLLNNTLPIGLEHYPTLVIQVLDLGVVAPTGILTGILLLKRRPMGYLLASVVIIKGITMLTAISGMIIGQLMVGEKISYGELILFPVFNLMVIYCLILIIRNVKEPQGTGKEMEAGK